jgi:hypothetical protein
MIQGKKKSGDMKIRGETGIQRGKTGTERPPDIWSGAKRNGRRKKGGEILDQLSPNRILVDHRLTFLFLGVWTLFSFARV